MDSKIIFAVLLSVNLATALHFEDSYPYNRTLSSDPSYTLYWKVNLEDKEISFAVAAKTEGWVGFGLAMRPSMINSDVVIGWINTDGSPELHVRIAHVNQDCKFSGEARTACALHYESCTPSEIVSCSCEIIILFLSKHY